jgi:serine/threonine protein kinase
MPVPATIDELVDLSQKSGILDRKGLDDYLQRVRSGPSVPTGPQDLAAVMVRDGLLTRFQADQLLQGKWRNFLIGGKYKLLDRIGEGGRGAVFLCEHLRLQRRVAVKVLPPNQARGGAAKRFERKARAVASLDHPNLVKIQDVDHDGKLHYLVMEYVEGSSLQDIVKKKGPFDARRACHYVVQACLGLQHAHDKGVVHRDLQPANLLLDRSGIIKILDLGLARFFNDHSDPLTRDHDATAILDSADYLAPEQAADRHCVDARADIYSLGMTFYFLLAGKAPFAEGTLNEKLVWHQLRNPEPVTNRRPDLPPEVAALLGRMIEKDPAARFQSPSEVAAALAPWVQTPISRPPEDEMPELGRAALGGGPGPQPLRPAGTIETTPGVLKSNESALGDAAFAPADQLDERGVADGLDWKKILLWARRAAYGMIVLAFLGGITWWALNRPGK